MERFLTSYIIESIISGGIFYLLFIVILKRTTNHQFNRFYLLTSSILTAVIPFINFQPGIISNGFQNLNMFPYSKIVSDNFISSDLQANSEKIQVSSSSIQIIDILVGVYILVASIFLLRFLIGLTRLLSLYRKNPVQKKEHYTIVYFEKNYSPFSFFKYIFINHKYNNEEYFNTIVEHEKVHVLKRHSIDVILLELVSIMQWYNPLIWLMKKSIKEIHEFQVDEKVIAQGFDSNSYFSLLLNKIVGIQAMDFANCFNKSLIKKRILMMEKTKSKRTRIYMSLLVIPLSLLLIAFTIDFNKDNTLNNQPNLSDYQTTADDEIPEGWFKAGRNPQNYNINVQHDEGEECIVMVSEDGGENGFGNLMQTFTAENYLNKRIRFSGKIKTEDAKYGAMLWMRVDGKSKTKSLAFDNMNGRQPKGTTDWTNYEIVLDVPENAVAINIGMMLSKEGKAFFKDLNFEEVDSNTPTTDFRTKNFPDKPVNLELNK